MKRLWSRLRARRAPPAADRGLDYRASWDRLAAHDALGAICHGADAARFEDEGRKHAEELRAFLRPDWRVLDFGCGIGRLEAYLAGDCREIQGVDVSEAMLVQARRRLAGLPNVHLHRLEGLALPMFVDGSFDFAIAFLVFHHLAKQDVYLVLREFRRVVRPGGRFFANFPNLLSEGYGRVFEQYALERERAAHRVRCYTPEEVRWLVARVGATIVQEKVHGEIELLAEFSR